MSDNQQPSRNPADDNNLTGVIRNAIRKEMQNVDGMMPFEVVSYDRATNRATVRPLVQMMGSDGEKKDRAQIASVRVLQPGNAAYSVSLPIKPGDKGWMFAGDRDLSLFQQDLDTPNAPNTRRQHSFQDGLFMPDAMANGDAPAGMGDRVVIGLNGGGATMSLDADGFYFNVGGVEYALTAAGFAQTGGTQTHNGVNVGDTHIHGGVETGGGTTTGPV